MVCGGVGGECCVWSGGVLSLEGEGDHDDLQKTAESKTEPDN